MYIRRDYSDKSPARQARRRNTAVGGGSSRQQHKQARRTINSRPNVCAPFAPPEDWHESTDREGYRVVIQEPGEGYGTSSPKSRSASGSSWCSRAFWISSKSCSSAA